MIEPDGPIWLASYPRSGNTLLRTILHHCFGLVSASAYPNDLGGSAALEAYVGHVEHDAAGGIRFPDGTLPLIKTHERPSDGRPAIYVVRDGRAACVSLWAFYDRSLPLAAVISGRHRFGTWSDHLSAWQPWARARTLLLRYEDLAALSPTVLDRLGGFLGRAIIADAIPERDRIAGVDGRWVRPKSDWRAVLGEGELALFDRINGPMIARMGYGGEKAG